MPCRGVALVKSQENIEGFLLVEVLLYMTIFSLVIGMVLLLHNEEQREYHVFDREGRILFAHVKRMQLATLYGNLQNNNGANRVVLERMRYGYINTNNSLVYRNLPESMHIEFTGTYPSIRFTAHKGVGKVFTVTLVDDLIRYKRTLIFARQSGRIRWEESKF